jgi:galactose mutarotase-like enzyme
VITLAAGPLEAGFAPEAGMVCHSLRHEGEELLAQRDGIEGYVRAGRWMGVPLLHPWANRLADWSYEALGRRVDLRPLAGDAVVRDPTTGLPIHGVLPRAWAVVEASATRVVAELSPADGPAFPFPHRMRLEAALSPGALRIATTLEPVEGDVPVAFGFHPWLTLPGVRRVAYEVELPAMRRLALDASQVPSGETEERPPFAGTVAEALDDGFDRVQEGAVFAVTGGGRRIEVRFESGYPCAQVFAPVEKDLICFEPMTAPSNALRTGAFPVATPQAPFAAVFSVSVARA